MITWVSSIKIIVLVTLVVVLIEVDNSFALKCYKCRPRQLTKKCDPESRGELQTCVHSDDLCFKIVTTTRMKDAKENYPEVGEARQKGCDPFFRKNHTLGCNYLSEHTKVCYCDTDRCNAHQYPPE